MGFSGRDDRGARAVSKRPVAGRWPAALVLAALAQALTSAQAGAQTLPDLEPVPSIYEQPGLNANRSYEAQHATEAVDPFSGKLKLEYVDLFVPGNGGLDIKVRRSYASQQANGALGEASPFGIGWTMSFGRLMRKATTLLCARGVSSTVAPVLELPGGAREVLYESPGGALTFISPNRYQGRCQPDGNGMTVYAPDGTRWEFTRSGPTVRSQAVWHPVRIVDRNDNDLRLSYVRFGTFDAVSRIEASDGRVVTFTYTGAADNPRLETVSDGRRTIRYEMRARPATASGYYYLDKVIRADGSSWRYGYDESMDGAASNGNLVRLQYPQGGTLEYRYAHVDFYAKPADPLTSVVIRKLSSDGGVWLFSYRPGTRPYFDADRLQADPPSLDKTTVDAPNGRTEYWHLGYAGAQNAEFDMSIGYLLQKNIGTQHFEGYEYTKQKISDQLHRRADGSSSFGVWVPLVEAKNVVRGSGLYRIAYSNFDEYGNPRTITETGTEQRTTTLVPDVKPDRWLIRLIKQETVSTVPGTITRVFDDRGNVLSEEHYGTKTTFTYHGTGDLHTRTDARSNVWTYTDYRRGLPQTELLPENVRVQRVFTPEGWLASETNPELGSTTWTYDGLGRIERIDRALGNPLVVDWTATTRTLSRGPYREVATFDGFNRLVELTRNDTARNESVVQVYRYNPLGQRTFQSYPGSQSQGLTFAYDQLDRMVEVRDSAGAKRTWSDLSDQLTVTDERGFKTISRFRTYGDPDARELTSVTPEIAGAETVITRNGLGQVLTVAQGGRTRTYGYDARYFLTSITQPETGQTLLGRDAIGNLTSRRVGNGPIVEFVYDGLSRLTETRYPTGTTSITRSHYRDGLVKSIKRGDIELEYRYNANRKLIDETLRVEGLVYSTGYLYDGNDFLSEQVYASGRRVQYQPDAFGRARAAIPYVNAIDYHPTGEVASMSFANGATTSTTLDQRRLLRTWTTTGAGTSLVNHTYTYDESGNLTALLDAADPAGSRTLGYDALNRLVSASGSWGTGVIAYDGMGNITSQQYGGEVLSYAYDGGTGRLQSVTGARSYAFAYDRHGNVVSDGAATFEYDEVPSLTCAGCASAGGVKYRYGGDQIRVTREQDGRKTYFVSSREGLLLSEITPGEETKERVYVGGRQVADITTAALVGRAVVRQAFNRSLGPFGLSAGATFSITGGALPPGLSLDPSSGLITGVPTESGTYAVSFEIAGGGQAAVQASIQIVVGAPAQPAAVSALGSWLAGLLSLMLLALGARTLKARALVCLLLIPLLAIQGCRPAPWSSGDERKGASAAAPDPVASPPRAAPPPASLPAPEPPDDVTFAENRGQVGDPRLIRFAASTSTYDLRLEDGAAVLSVGPAEPEIRLRLLGARPSAIDGEELLPRRSHHYIGPDPKRWFTNVRHYRKVRYRDVYPGIDQIFYGKHGQVEYDLVVKPGADPKAIGLAIQGAPVHLGGDDLVIATRRGELRHAGPVAYQDIDGRRVPVHARYTLRASGKVQIELGGYDRGKELVIDPSFGFTTYLGSTQPDHGRGVTVDSAGNIYLVGARGPQAYVAKLSPAGAILAETFLGTGGSASAFGQRIAINAAANIAISGWVDGPGLPVAGSFRPRFGGGGSDGFVARLAPDLTLAWASYAGGFRDDAISGLAIDDGGSVFIAGTTSSPDFPTATGALRPSCSNGCLYSDMFVAKVAPGGGALVYSTFLGGMSEDGASDLAIDSAGHAYVCGVTYSATFPIASALQPSCGGGCNPQGFDIDGAVAKLAPDGASLVFSTFLGGDGTETIASCALDAAGLHVVGTTRSTNFAVPTGSTASGSEEGFVAKLASDGQALLFARRPGFTGAVQVAVDGARRPYLFGTRLTAPALDGLQPAPAELFVGRLAADASAFEFASPLGRSWGEYQPFLAGGIAVATNGAIVLTGATTSNHLPVVFASQPAPASAVGSNGALVSPDIFLMRIDPGATPLALAHSPSPADSSMPVKLQATLHGAAGAIVFMEGRRELGRAPLVNDRAELSVALAAGEHLVHATYSGGGGAPAAASRIVSIPVRGPTTAQLLPSQSDVTQGVGVLLYGLVTGQSPTGTVTFKEGSTTLGVRTLPANDIVVTPAAGDHIYAVEYSGDAYNRAATSPGTLVRVHPGPTAAISSPLDGAGYATNATIPVVVSASARGSLSLQRVDLLVDGVVVQQKSTPPYTFSLAASTLSEGEHTLIARAIDGIGGTGNSPPVRVRVSSGGPIVSWTGETPGNDSTLPALGGVWFGVTVASPTQRPISSVAFTVNGAPVSASGLTGNIASLAPGNYVLVATATDSAGASGQAPPIHFVVAPRETVHYVHTDVAGTPLAATNEAGELLWRESYRPYGAREQEPPAAGGQGLFWKGKPEESVGDLQYFGARYYSPTLGRFYGVDSEEWSERDAVFTFNRYAFGNDNPYRYGDSTGRFTSIAAVAGIFATVLIFAALSEQAKRSTRLGGYSTPDMPNLGIESYPAETSRLPNILTTPGVALPQDKPGGYVVETPKASDNILEKVGPNTHTYLYEKVGPNGEHLKYGITVDPDRRYTKAELNGGGLKILAQGKRKDMLKLERDLHETLPIGPEERQSYYIDKQIKKGLKSPPY